MVFDEGRARRAYGLYQGGGVAQNYFHARIIILRDTLLRDFGHDREMLLTQIARTVRHEVAHHLGWDENGARGLGLSPLASPARESDYVQSGDVHGRVW